MLSASLICLYFYCCHALYFQGIVSAQSRNGSALPIAATSPRLNDSSVSRLAIGTNTSVTNKHPGTSTIAALSEDAAPTSGSGPAYAISCQSDLWQWSVSSQEYASRHAVTKFTTYDYTQINTLVGTDIVYATRLTTLCDGHPRVVGYASISLEPGRVTTYSDAGNYSLRIPATDFPVPVPCSINPTDCAALFSIDRNSAAQSELSWPTELPDVYPPCTTLQPTFSTGPAGQVCDICSVQANAARLLYWPVTTSRNLCSDNATQEWKRTVDTPRSFVTDGITITSPSVGISLGGVSRSDGCGATVASTIIVVPPEAVSSIRGAEALYAYHPFDFEDLNWICQAPNSTTSTIQQAGGDDCYQDVPAIAYFGGTEQFLTIGEFNNAQIANVTIRNDYHPQLVYPAMWSETMTKIWGTDCWWQVDGHLDPPRALQEQSSVPTLSLPTPVQTTTDTLPTTTPATPAGYSVSHVSVTAVPDTIPTTLASQAGDSGAVQPTSTNSSPSELTGVIPASSSIQHDSWSTENPSGQSGAWSGTRPSDQDSLLSSTTGTGLADSSKPDVQSQVTSSQDLTGQVSQTFGAVGSVYSEVVSTDVLSVISAGQDSMGQSLPWTAASDSPLTAVTGTSMQSGIGSNGESDSQDTLSPDAFSIGHAGAPGIGAQSATPLSASDRVPGESLPTQLPSSNAQTPSKSNVFSSDAHSRPFDSVTKIGSIFVVLATTAWMYI